MVARWCCGWSYDNVKTENKEDGKGEDAREGDKDEKKIKEIVHDKIKKDWKKDRK